jgi:hypothetical protein
MLDLREGLKVHKKTEISSVKETNREAKEKMLSAVFDDWNASRDVREKISALDCASVNFYDRDFKLIDVDALDKAKSDIVRYIHSAKSGTNPSVFFVRDGTADLPAVGDFLKKRNEQKFRCYTPKDPNPPEKTVVLPRKIASIISSVVSKLGLSGGTVIIGGVLGALLSGHLILGLGFFIAIVLGIALFLLFGVGGEVLSNALSV